MTQPDEPCVTKPLRAFLFIEAMHALRFVIELARLIATSARRKDARAT